jgi:exosortase/archaeosortase family protein
VHPLLIATVVMAATWGAWRWYFERVWAAPEEAAALVLTVVFLGVLGMARNSTPGAPRQMPLVPIALLLTAYVASYPVLPSIARAAIAIAATGFCFYLAIFKERPPVAFWGLVALSLPVLPSLQFTLGYPMRVVSAALTVALLQAHGLVLARQGTFLVWRGEMIQFDAPCSGVNMLSAGLLLALMGCVLFRLSAGKVMVASAASVAVILACNVLRASSLFYLEAGFVPQAAGWWHEGIGIAAFMLSALVIIRLLGRLRNREAIAWAR